MADVLIAATAERHGAAPAVGVRGGSVRAPARDGVTCRCGLAAETRSSGVVGAVLLEAMCRTGRGAR
jgi:hypothetical protein